MVDKSMKQVKDDTTVMVNKIDQLLRRRSGSKSWYMGDIISYPVSEENGWQIFLSRGDNNSCCGVHSHIDSLEVITVLAGSAKIILYSINGGEIRESVLRCGETLTIVSKVPHNLIMLESGTCIATIVIPPELEYLVKDSG